MNNRLEFEKGIRLEPVTSTDIDQKGELEVLSTGGKLNYHNGTTASPVVTESHSATLTNKVIDGDDNTVQDLALTSLKTVIGDANKIIKRNASGVVVSSSATLDASDNLKTPGTIYSGSGSIDASAILQLDSTTKGVGFPRMTTAQRNAIASPLNSLWIFNTDTRIFEYYDIVSTSWAAVGAGAGGVVLTAQESLGTGDGIVTNFGPLANVPNSEESVLVTIDGIVESEANWSLSGSTIIFGTAPAAAQTIYVYYMYGAGPGGGGEANTASNMGTGADGEGLASTKVGVDLPFKRIKAGTGITVTPETNDVLITSADTASNLGSGSGVFKQKTLANFEFKTLVAGSGITLTPGTNDITIASTSSSGPTIQRFTSGSGTYTTPANVKWIKVRAVGAGGGGSGSSDNTFNAGNGDPGTNTTFGTSLLIAGLGAGGTHPIAGGAVAGAGGSNTINSPAVSVINAIGGTGGSNLYRTGGNVNGSGGSGGTSALGGTGAGRVGNGGNGQTNTGSGGAGGGQTSASGDFSTGSGGGSGGYLEAIISAPSASYSYVVGVSGGGGSAGSGGSSGGIGGSGLIVVEEYY